MVDFKNLAWATGFATRQVENPSTCPTGQVEKKLLSYPGTMLTAEAS